MQTQSALNQLTNIRAMSAQTVVQQEAKETAHLSSGAALESMSTSSPSQRQLQHQLNQQIILQPDPNPKKLNSSAVIDIAGIERTYANALNKACSDGITGAYTPTLPHLHTQCKRCECLRCSSDASIVLRVPLTPCSASLCPHSAQLHLQLAPTACKSLAAAPATVGPETLATNQTTCRTVCSTLALHKKPAMVEEKKYLADYQRCYPLPLFIILVSLLEITVFIYDYMTVQLLMAAFTMMARGPSPQIATNKTFIPSESLLIYRPDRRLELWRFVSYMMLHANWFHLSFNVVVQLVYGLPLELVHGSARVAVIYLAGVFAGSLGTSVVDSEAYLVGASGGVYALLASHLANILLNFGQMRDGLVQLARIILFVSCDLGYGFYSKYYSRSKTAHSPAKTQPSVSYIAHLTGALAGFTMGLMVLKNFDNSKAAQAKLLWWLALGVYTAFTVFAIAFNLINTVTAQMLEEDGEAATQHLLENLGIS